MGVLLSRHVPDRPPLEAREGRPHLRVKFAQARVLHPVFPADLLDDQLRVADQLELIRAQGAGPLDAQENGPVLGDVVRCAADRLGALVEDGPVRVREHSGDRRRPRVAARTAVDVDDQPLAQAS